MLLDVTIQPVMFVLLFAFVFGGSIDVAGSTTGSSCCPGSWCRPWCSRRPSWPWGSPATSQKGIVDRFKSLPISRSSVLVGRSISSLIHSSIGIVVMGVTGLLIGWRIRNGLANAVLGYLLLLLFGFSMIWLGIWVGSMMRSVEAVQGFMFTVMFPLTFVANTFAPTENMPTWLRTIAEWNPVSAVTQACRELWGNGPPPPADAQWPLQHPVLASIGWSIVFTAVFAPLALAAFRRRSRD